MPADLFAFLDINAERFTQLVVNTLAVGGAFMVGYFGSGFSAWLLDRWLLAGKSPQGLHKTIKYTGGLAAAILAAMILFGHGYGWTLMGGAADGSGNGPSEEKGGGPGTGAVAITVPTRKESPPTARTPEPLPPDPGTKFERVLVTVLAGEEVRDGRFYRVDDKPEPRTLKEVEAELKARQQAANRPVGVVPLYPPNSGFDTIGAKLLLALAQREGYTVIPAGTPK